jgi:hypothetical protein
MDLINTESKVKAGKFLISEAHIKQGDPTRENMGSNLKKILLMFVEFLYAIFTEEQTDTATLMNTPQKCKLA